MSFLSVFWSWSWHMHAQTAPWVFSFHPKPAHHEARPALWLPPKSQQAPYKVVRPLRRENGRRQSPLAARSKTATLQSGSLDWTGCLLQALELPGWLTCMGRWCSRKPLAMASRVRSLIDPNPGSSLLRIQKLMRKTWEGSERLTGYPGSKRRSSRPLSEAH